MGSHIVMGEKLVGEVDGVLKIIAFEGLKLTNTGHHVSMYRVKCLHCGQEQILSLSSLRRNTGTGCWYCRIGRRTHGESDTRLYNIWEKIKGRCFNDTDAAYSRYGGRGITMCDEWNGENGYINFRAWALSNGYKRHLSIDRINNDGNYEPSNCRWADRFTQANNKRNNTIIICDGKSLTLAEWSRETGIKSHTIHARLKAGWSAEKALYTKAREQKARKI